MTPIATCTIVFACIFGCAMLGMFIKNLLPEQHLNSDSKDVVKIAMALVATISALVLSLLISSAKASFDVQNTELNNISAKIILLDRTLAYYGPDAQEPRQLLRDSVTETLDRIWPNGHVKSAEADDSSRTDRLYESVQRLVPADDKQRSAKSQAMELLGAIAQAHWLMYEQRTVGIPRSLLIVLVSWLAAMFVSFGLFAPRNGTTIAALFVSAFSVSAAILMILELYTPYGGLIEISSAPLRAALMHLGK